MEATATPQQVRHKIDNFQSKYRHDNLLFLLSLLDIFIPLPPSPFNHSQRLIRLITLVINLLINYYKLISLCNILNRMFLARNIISLNTYNHHQFCFEDNYVKSLEPMEFLVFKMTRFLFSGEGLVAVVIY